MSAILEGIRVLEWAHAHQGAYAGSMLGSLGAEVIKIEPPGKGDSTRGYKRLYGLPIPQGGGQSLYYEMLNCNKKSVTIDVTKERGKEIVYRLVTKSDVFLTNYRMEVAHRLGLDYETVSKHNPRLVYAFGSGFGSRGPDADLRAIDATMQARSGLMWIAGEPGMAPLPVVGGIVDQTSAIILAFGIVAALLARERLGIAQQVEISLLGSTLCLQAEAFAIASTLNTELPRYDRKNVVNPFSNYYRCRDGKWLYLGQVVDTPKHWPQFCRVFGREDLVGDPRCESLDTMEANRRELIRLLDEIFVTKTTDEWAELLRKEGLIFAKVNRPTDLPGDPQVIANEYGANIEHPVLEHMKVVRCPMTFSKTPAGPERRAPQLGQHTEEVLTGVGGYSWDEVAELREQGVL